jgi:hypothetical protein
MSTPYHAKYLAYELTRRLPAEKAEKLSQSLCNATVDLNPHQIEAALFAFRSPLSRGAILADEVGLGKTIEAGLIISQLWAEQKRQILCIVPASLRKQWDRELTEKFYIDSSILESASYRLAKKEGSDILGANGHPLACQPRQEFAAIPYSAALHQTNVRPGPTVAGRTRTLSARRQSIARATARVRDWLFSQRPTWTCTLHPRSRCRT